MNKRNFAPALLVILTVLTLSGSLFAEEKTISLEECLALAEANHPALEEARAALAGQQAKLGQVRVSNALKGNLSASGSRNSGSDGSYTTSFSVSKLLSDSGKNALERKSQGLSVDAASESQRETVLSVRTGVKDAYYGLLLAMRKRDQAESAVKTYQRHLDKARGFYDAGVKARFDVTKAEVDLSNARIDLVSAESSLETARAALSRAVGVPLDHARPVSDFLAPRDIPAENFALEQALENRPDIRSSRLKSRAGKLGISIAAKGNAATISVTGSAKLSGTGLPPDDDYSVGITLSVPVFDGGLTDYRIAEARASADGLDASLKKLEQTVRYEVRSALLSVREAEARIPAAELLVRQAEENLTLAEGRYEMGVGNVLEVADALLAFNSARVSHFQALHDYSTAVSDLEQTLGGEFK
ncbi:MAG TPA: TolC family protein [Aminivibrio sp.]|uniref:TolC family protein n=1 Tax=Aminivibrio sp. TaxID=1872489 RepID=UPI002C2BFA44|nr:TolC family protein [Aminivibrio sp.]